MVGIAGIVGIAGTTGTTGATGLNLNGARVERSGDEGFRGSHLISTTREMKYEASDGSFDGIWDGGTLPIPPKQKGDFTILPCGGEGPRKSVENLKHLGSLDCNKKWSTLFGSNLKGKAITPVPHKVDLKSSSCSISIQDCIVERNMANLASVLAGKFIGPQPNIEVVRDWVSRK